ncbi:MAG: LAGLIDADG family homing endonuclease [Nanoarchaeota archaeon]
MPYDIITGRNASDKKDFANKGLCYIGKGFVKMGQYTSLSNKIFMDVIRSHVILVAGKRGCLTENTMIFTDKGYKPIKDFDEKRDKILSFDKEKKEFEWETAELLKYPVKDENLFQIELNDGRRINLTKEHPLLSSYGKYFYYCQARDLKINDKIVLPTSIPEIKNDKESLRIARLLGYILSDGTINIQKGRFKDGRGQWYNGTKARIRIYNNSDEVLNQAKEDLEKEFNIIAKRYKRNDCNCEIVETKHQKIINRFMELGIPKGLKSGIIRIPKIVFESSNEFKSEFISALFDCDGYVPKDCKTLDYSSKSREFLEDLQILLTHFNIESVIRVKNSKCNGKIFEDHRLFITDNNSVENFKKIGLKNKFKLERLKLHKANGTRKRKTFYPNNKLVCIKIKSIKEIDKIKEVYDLRVPKNHSFIAEGIISSNSGKSYTLGVIAEELSDLPKEVSQNIASLIFDTMGIYWTMKYPNEKDKELLQEWGLKPKNLKVKVFVPYGFYDDYLKRGIPVDEQFALDVYEMDAEDWILTFGLDIINPVAVLIERTITKLKERKTFEIEDIIKEIEKDEKTDREIKNAGAGLFEAANTWGIFSKSGIPPTKINGLVNAGITTVLDLSIYNSVGSFNVRALVISLISRKLFNQRMEARKKEEIESISKGLDFSSYSEKKESPLVWIFIDEAHEFLPLEGKTIASDALTQLLREGRQPGISLVLATQQPGQIHRDVMTQSDIVISHRVTSAPDLEALNKIMQSYLLESIKQYMDDLPSLRGSAIILDDNSERIYPMRVRPRFTWHGGEAPTAIKPEKKI